MAKAQYPERKSKVTITFVDGEVKSYEMTAGPGISQWLMREAADTGFILIRNDAQRCSTSVPVSQIRDIEIREIQEGTSE